MHLTSFARTALIASALLSVAACGPRPSDSAYLNRGGPESLLDVSSEVVNLSVSSKNEVKDLTTWIERDQPTRAEMNCSATDKNCTAAQKALDSRGVPTADGNGADHTVTLVYERILARDCNQRYVNNVPNYYNTNHAAFGCSIAANIVQEVTDKREFINPNLSDDPSAVRAVNDVRRAYAPRKIVEPYGVGDSTVAKSKTQ